MDQSLSRQEKAFLLLSCSFVVLLVTSNVIAGKIITIGGLFAPAAVLCYSLTFATTDTLAEIWGKDRTRFVVNVGFFVTVLSALFIRLAIITPAAPFWQEQEAFAFILGGNLRIVLASLTAYLISQHHDIWAFTFWKEKTGDRHLWLRNNLSTGVSQLLDTGIFITLAFYGTGTPLFSMVFGQYVIKVLIGLLDTPIVYLLVHLTKRFTLGQGDRLLVPKKINS
ncbi:MAG: queuosine precursor transporter [Bacillota bacterium]|nr:queuosine precursor transporter [Bacillota bacterium]MDW7682724.1 queuosine precursor transporter [Bacillota bacterium]